jgi:hypothetical protein
MASGVAMNQMASAYKWLLSAAGRTFNQHASTVSFWPAADGLFLAGGTSSELILKADI